MVATIVLGVTAKRCRGSCVVLVNVVYYFIYVLSDYVLLFRLVWGLVRV